LKVEDGALNEEQIEFLRLDILKEVVLKLHGSNTFKKVNAGYIFQDNEVVFTRPDFNAYSVGFKGAPTSIDIQNKLVAIIQPHLFQSSGICVKKQEYDKEHIYITATYLFQYTGEVYTL